MAATIIQGTELKQKLARCDAHEEGKEGIFEEKELPVIRCETKLIDSLEKKLLGADTLVIICRLIANTGSTSSQDINSPCATDKLSLLSSVFLETFFGP